MSANNDLPGEPAPPTDKDVVVIDLQEIPEERYQHLPTIIDTLDRHQIDVVVLPSPPEDGLEPVCNAVCGETPGGEPPRKPECYECSLLMTGPSKHGHVAIHDKDTDMVDAIENNEYIAVEDKSEMVDVEKRT